MDMQDKEFDDVFRNKLDGFEAEPSAKVWMGIDVTLDEKSRKKAILPWLGIAASIIVLVSAGILFIPKKTVPQHNNRIAKAQPAQTIIKPKQEIVINTPAPQTELAAVQIPVKSAIHRVKKAEQMIAPVEKPTEVIAQTEPVQTIAQPVLAAIPQKQEQSNQAVVPRPETALTIKQPDVNNAPDQQTKPALVAQQQTTATKPAFTASPKKHGIRNLGDLVSLVADKVDKRRAARLNDDDDDDESVIGEVNKGIQKIKKDRAQQEDK
jgi:hypothetical protein